MWLCNRHDGPAAPFRRALGAPADAPLTVRRAYGLLDRSLFIGDRLIPPSRRQKGNGRGAVADTHRRYRLLARAYHPDRFPSLAPQLTRRSQAINAAYTDFKFGRPEQGSRPRRTQTRPRRSAPTRHVTQSAPMRRMPVQDKLLALAERLAHIQHLPQKLFAVALVLLVLLFMHFQS